MNDPHASTHHYVVYGLGLRSNWPLPSLSSSPHRRVDVEIVLHPRPLDVDYEHAQSVSHGAPPVTAWFWPDRRQGRRYRLAEDEHVDFLLTPAPARIDIHRTPRVADRDVHGLLLGHVLSLLVQLRGDRRCLHGSAVVRSGAAYAILGATGAGKSTTAAALVEHGCAALTDDLVVLDAPATAPSLVHAGYPLIRLRGDAARGLDRVPRDLPTLWSPDGHGGGKCAFDPTDAHLDFCEAGAPLGGIYLLQPRRSGRGRPTIGAVAAKAAVPELMQHVYALPWLDDDARRTYFEWCVGLARTIPLRAVTAFADLDALPLLARSLAADMDALPAASRTSAAAVGVSAWSHGVRRGGAPD